MCLNARVCAPQTSDTHVTPNRCIERVSPASFRLSVGSSLSLANLHQPSTFPLLFRSFADHAT